MADQLLTAPLLARYWEPTPPTKETGGRTFSSLPSLNSTDGGLILAVEQNGISYQIALEDLVGGEEDLQFAASAINPPGLASDPTFDTDNIGWLFDGVIQNILLVSIQIPHWYKQGTNISPHIHWTQTHAGSVYWQIEYKWYNNGEEEPAAFTTLGTATPVFTYSADSPLPMLAQITDFGHIDGTDKKISSIFKMKLSRLPSNPADNYTGDALLDSFDIHFESNGHLSQHEYSKQDRA